ncbi:MAG: gamma-glutamyltransferase [Desulfurococcales archaeon]|nr:gamma-glutamyltransferase [Desulfurococcales archaeon]
MYKASVGKAGISADHPLAVKAGIEVLENGGNAFDAAIAVSSVLSVVHPFSGGLGGDSFLAAFLGDDKVFIYNGSGASPSGFDPELYIKNKPARGPLTLTVPGLVELWGYIEERFCKKSLRELLIPAISLAENGFYADSFLVKAIRESKDYLIDYEDWAQTYIGIEEGNIIYNKGMAEVLKEISSRGWETFYKGKLAEKLVDILRSKGVGITLEDLETHRGFVQKALSLDLGDKILYEIPPNSQGLSTLNMISALHELGLDRYGFDDIKRLALWEEPTKKIYIFRDLHLGDPRFMDIDPSKYTTYSSIIESIDKKTRDMKETREGNMDTTFFVTVDREGNIVGFIQSLYHWFGSGIIALGIPFQSRGAGFSLLKGVPNEPAPRKKPLHTLSVLLIEDHGSAEPVKYVIGCASGDHRPQIHTRIYENIFVYRMDLEAAIEAPRFIYISPSASQKLIIEEGLDGPQGFSKIVTKGSYTAMGRVNACKYHTNRSFAILSPDPRSPSISIAIN